MQFKCATHTLTLICVWHCLPSNLNYEKLVVKITNENTCWSHLRVNIFNILNAHWMPLFFHSRYSWCGCAKPCARALKDTHCITVATIYCFVCANRKKERIAPRCAWLVKLSFCSYNFFLLLQFINLNHRKGTSHAKCAAPLACRF